MTDPSGGWDERFRAGEYPTDPEPAPLLRTTVDARSIPAEGRAMDVATGTGRNAVFLASAGYAVDAIDRSRAGLDIARENARDEGVSDRIEWIQADLSDYPFPTATYDLVTISFYRAVDRFPDIKEALAPNGLLFVEHHLRSADAPDAGPSGDRYRFAANELLHSCLDMTVLHYTEHTESRADGRSAAIARIVARKSVGNRQSYPRIDPGSDRLERGGKRC